MTYEDFDAVLDVHLRGAFHVVRPAFPLMCEAGYGRIVLTSSIGGLYGNHDVANYAAAKAGVIGLSNVAAHRRRRHGVKCNVIVPAAVTRMAEGIDTSAYPPMGSGARRARGGLAGARILFGHRRDADRPGGPGGPGRRRGEPRRVPAVVVDRADVGEHIDAIRELDAPVVFPVVPDGHADHIRYSFGMAAQGAAHG